MNDDEMRNISGLQGPFILSCCHHWHLSRTFDPQEYTQIHHLLRIAAVCGVGGFTGNLEFRFCLAFSCLCKNGNSEAVLVVMFDTLFRFDRVQSTQSASLSQLETRDLSRAHSDAQIFQFCDAMPLMRIELLENKTGEALVVESGLPKDFANS